MTTLSINDTKLADDVLAYLATRHDGRESLSYLLSEMRDKGWRGLGQLHDFETTLEHCGFTLERVYTKNTHNIRMTWVTV